MVDAAAVFALGFALGLSLAAPPGPILSVSAHRVVQQGFWPGLFVGLGAMTGDGTYALLMGLGAIPLIARIDWLAPSLSFAGGILLAWFAYGAWHSARHPPDLAEGPEPTIPTLGLRGPLPAAFAAGYLMALSSPFNFGWWFGVGTTLFQDYGAWVFVGFFAGILAWVVVFTLLVLWLHRRVKGVMVAVSYLSAAILAGFAVFFLVQGGRDLVTFLFGTS